MSFTVPAMPLVVNVWHDPNFPPAAPDYATMGCLSFGRRVTEQSGTFDINLMYLLMPALSDVRSLNQNGTFSWVEAPAGTGRYYQVNYVDDVAKGFANEYRMVVLYATTVFGAWSIPIP